MGGMGLFGRWRGLGFELQVIVSDGSDFLVAYLVPYQRSECGLASSARAQKEKVAGRWRGNTAEEDDVEKHGHTKGEQHGDGNGD